MPITATRFTQFRPLGGDQDGDGFADAGDILRHTLTLNNTGTAATGVVVNDLLGGSTLTGAINVSPIAFADSFTAVGNTLMEVGNATVQTGPQSNVVGNILSNDVDFFSDTFTISAFDATSLNGGTVNVITTGVDAGSFTYVSAANFTGSDTFTYTIRDDGLDGIAGNSDDLVSIGTVTVTVSNQVWYVDSSFVGVSTGTSTNPFTTLTAVSGATGPDTDGDTIYVNTGTGDYTGGITLLNNQILHGEGTALVVGGFNLAAAGTDPTIANAAGNGVTLAQGNTLTGFTVGNTTGFDIANTTAATVGNLTISNVNLAGTGGLFRADSGGTLNVTFDSASTTSAAGNGIHLAGATSGTFTVTGGAISGVAGTDVLVNGGTATIAIGSSITSNAGGSIDIGSHATGNVTLSGAINITGGTGISVHNNTSGTIAFTNASQVVSTGTGNAVDLDSNTGATINFTGGGLDIDTTSGFGFEASGGGTFSVTGAGNSVTTTSGTAVNLNSVTVGASGMTLASLNTNGAANGVLINGVGQAAGSTGIDINGGAIVNASARGVDIAATSADVSVAATISTTGAGRSVEVTDSGGSGGRTIVFSGAIDENGLGINLDNNDQLGGIATINFTGGLDIDSTTNTGFNAINGGTINVTGTNTVNNTTGIGVNVANTTIGASGLTFQTVATSGATSGIILNTTGAGAFTVTGTGTAGSGGTITGSTGVGISLTSTGAVTLGRMIIQNSADDGVRATTVGGFRLDNSTVQNNGNVVGERGVELNNVTGTVTFLNTTMTGNAEDNLYVRNTSGTMNLTVTGSSFSSVSSTFGNDGIILIAAGTSTIVASITGSTFNNHRGDHFQVTTEADSNSTTHFTFSGNTLTGDRGVNYGGNDLGGSITINPGALTGTSNMTFNIANNNIQGAVSSGITINRSGDTGTLQGTIQGNTIGTAGTADSGSSQAHGIDIVNNDNGTVTVLVHDNDIFQYANLSGINIINRDGNGRLNATVTNNVVNSPGQFGTHGIHVQNGAASGDAGDIYLDMENNTLAGSGALGGTDFRIRQRFDADIFLESYAGGQYDTAAVISYLQGRNTGVETGSATVHAGSPDPNGYFTTGAGTVPQPNSPTLPPAPLFVNPVPLPDSGKSAGDGTGGDFVPPGSTDPTDPAPGATDPVRAIPDAGQPVVVDDGVISAAELALIVEAAIQRWADAGATEEQIAAMRAVTFSVENMSGLQIGSNQGGHIVLDDNAAGFNWFIDATPGDDSEYSGSGTQLTALPGTVAAMRVDLLTTVMHELGHQIGLTDTYASGDNDELMFGLVSMGERRLPGNDDLSGATGSPVAGIAFALTPINIGNIPAGQVVVVMWDSIVDGYTNQLVPTFVNFSTITGNNPGVFSVNSNSETMGPGGANNIILDSLTLGNLVFADVNKNGVFDAGDTGVNGVSVTLFADTNANGVLDGGDTQVGSSILTAGGGLYSFANLAPGDYIVRVDASNFTGGALNGRVTATGGSDPDDNVNDDDNGVDGAGGIVVSQAITLSHDNEPLAGPGNDTNNTLDFGFVLPNQAPTQTGLHGDTATWTEGGAAALLDLGSNMTLADTDSANFDGGTLTVLLSGGVLAQDGIFIENVGTITSTANTVSFGVNQIATYVGGGFGGGNIVFTFDADATPAAVQALMRALSYNNNAGDNPTGGTRAVTWTLVDGDGTANGGADTLLIGSSVDVLAVNDAPEGGDNTLALDEDGTRILTEGNFFFSDPAEGHGFAGVVITTLPTNGRLLLDGNPITLAGTFVTAVQINSNLLVFQPDPNENGTPYGSFTFQVRDNGGILNGGQDTDQSANTLTFNVAEINDAPVIGLALTPAGAETRANTTTAGDQIFSSVAGLTGGGHVVLWQSPDGGGFGIYMQRYAADGTPLGVETRVNTVTAGDQFEPAVTALNGGGYVVTWQSVGQDLSSGGIYMQRFDGSGVAQGVETRVNTVTAGNQQFPWVSALADGGYVVVWTGPDAAGAGVFGQRYNSSGVAQGGEFAVNNVTAGTQQLAAVAGLAGGGFAVTWHTDSDDGSGTAVLVRRFDANGVAQGDAVRANTFTAGNQIYPSIGALADGGYVVTWESFNQDGSGNGIYAQRYNASGATVGTEFRVNVTTVGSQEAPNVAGLDDGGFLISWRSEGQDGSDYGIYARRYAVDGTAIGGDTLVNTVTSGAQYNPKIDTLAGGGIVISWHSLAQDGSGWGIYAQRFADVFTATEQVALSLKGRITVSDVDAGAAVVTATLSVGYGVLNVNVGGSGATIDSGNGTGSVVVSGTLAQINALLNSDATSIVTFTANTDAPPASTALTVTVNDGGATGADPGLTGDGDDEQGSATATINILALNDSPVVTVASPLAVDEQVAEAIAPAGTLADLDLDAGNGGNGDYAGSTLTIAVNGGATAQDVLSVVNGAGFTVNGGNLEAGGLVFATFAGGNGAPLVITFTSSGTEATSALADAVLQAVQYTYTGDSPPASIQLDVTMDDGAPANAGQGSVAGNPAATTSSITVNITNTPENQRPVVDLDLADLGSNDDTGFFAEGGGDAAIGSSIAVTDTEGDNVLTATITITDPEAGDLLFANLPLPGGITIDGASTATTLILIGSASAATYATALGQVGFTSSSEDPTDGGTNPNRVITVTASDAGGAGPAATMTLTVAGVNDEPILIATGLDPTFPENTAAVDLYSTVTADTIEGGQTFTSMTLTVTNVFDGANEILTFDGSPVALTNGNIVAGTATNGLTVSVTVAGSTATVTFTGATLSEAALATLVDTLAYRNAAIPPTDGDRVVTITRLLDSGLDSGDNDNELVPNIVSTVDVEPDNQAPAVDLDGVAGGVNHAASYTEDGAAVAIGSGVAVTDPNSGSGDMIVSATITLTDRVAGDALTVTGALPPGIIAVTTPTAGAITIEITGTGTVAQYQALIESIQYSTTSHDPTVGGTDLARTITVTVNDGALDSAVATTIVTITATDDAPVAQPDDFTITEAGSIVGGNVFANNGSGLDSDADGPPLSVSAVSGGTVGVQFTLPSGALLRVNANGTFDYNPNGAFDFTPTAGSGADNTPSIDEFDYTLAGGGTATVTISITGLDNDDILVGTAGADMMYGGAGNDQLFALGGGDLIGGEEGNDYIEGGSGLDYLYGGIGNDSIVGGADADQLFGDDGDDLIGGDAGNDYIEGGSGLDLLYGGLDNDTIVGGADADQLFGNDGDDLIGGDAGDDYIEGGAGLDFLHGGLGNDTIVGGADADQLFGNDGDDLIGGNDGDDYIEGGAGLDYLYGGLDNDSIVGGGDADELFGQDGDDVIGGNDGDDYIEGGAGLDYLYGGLDNDNIVGGADADHLLGQDGDDVLGGDDGNDYIEGGAGLDHLYGGLGDDQIFGGAGSDYLIGGGDADTFAFTAALGATNIDTIADFTIGLDTIALSAAIFAGMAPGELDPGAFVIGTEAAGDSDRIIYDSATGALYFDNDGGGGNAAVQFATITAGLSLTASDFIVF